MQSALRMFVTGRAGRDSPLRTADLTIRKVAALEALSRYQSIEANWLDSIEATPNLWPTSALLDWYGLLKRGAGLKDRDRHLAEAEEILRSRLNFQATAMGFSTENTDYLWWLMISGDVNANRVLLAVLDEEKWREDLPAGARCTGTPAARALEYHGNNARGVLDGKFSAKFELEPVAGQAGTRLETQRCWSGTGSRKAGV
jgi:hypothetical protein